MGLYPKFFIDLHHFQALEILHSKKWSSGFAYEYHTHTLVHNIDMGFGYEYNTLTQNMNPTFFECECMITSNKDIQKSYWVINLFNSNFI